MVQHSVSSYKHNPEIGPQSNPAVLNYLKVVRTAKLLWGLKSRLRLREIMPHGTTECGHKMRNIALFLKTYANDNGTWADHYNGLTQDTTNTTVQ